MARSAKNEQRLKSLIVGAKHQQWQENTNNGKHSGKHVACVGVFHQHIYDLCALFSFCISRWVVGAIHEQWF